MSLDLAVVMPVYNEAANIRHVLEEWHDAFQNENVSFRFIVVNDGSRDTTLSILRESSADFGERLHVIDQQNSGHGRSCRAGYDLAITQECPWVMQLDSDGQCDPRFFHAFWAARTQADCVFGLRTVREDGPARKFISWSASWLTSLASGVFLRDANVPYRMIRREVLARTLQKIPADFDLQNIALAVALKKQPGLRWIDVPIEFRDRQGGTNSINIPKIAGMGWRMLAEIKRIQ